MVEFICVRWHCLVEPGSVKFVGHEIAPVVKDTLAVSTDILVLAPLPGLKEAVKALLSVWNACQKVEVSVWLVWTRIHSASDTSVQ